MPNKPLTCWHLTGPWKFCLVICQPVSTKRLKKNTCLSDKKNASLRIYQQWALANSYLYVRSCCMWLQSVPIFSHKVYGLKRRWKIFTLFLLSWKLDKNHLRLYAFLPMIWYPYVHAWHSDWFFIDFSWLTCKYRYASLSEGQIRYFPLLFFHIRMNGYGYNWKFDIQPNSEWYSRGI